MWWWAHASAIKTMRKWAKEGAERKSGKVEYYTNPDFEDPK